MSIETYGGTFVGRFYARWLGELLTGKECLTKRALTIQKLNATFGTVVVEVRCFNASGERDWYAVRVPGYCGYFGLDQFEWQGNIIEK